MTKYLRFQFLILSLILMMTPGSTSYGQDFLMDPLMRFSDMNDADYLLLQASLIVRTQDGNLCELFWREPMQEYAVLPVDDLFGKGPSQLVYWGEDFVNGALGKISDTWTEVKTYIAEILEKIREMTGLIGMIFIFVCSGIVTYFLNVTFPVLPSKWIFYTTFILICMGWISLTSVYKSVIYAGGILIVPHIVIGSLAMLSKRVRRKFGNKNPLKRGVLKNARRQS
jgi:hypothetical protein